MVVKYVEGFDMYPGAAVRSSDSAWAKGSLMDCTQRAPQSPNSVRIRCGDKAWIELPLREGRLTLDVRRDGETWLIDHTQEDV